MHAAGQTVQTRVQRAAEPANPGAPDDARSTPHANQLNTEAGDPSGSSLPSAIDETRILSALDRALLSPEFQSAPQLQSFLDFTVRSYLADHSKRIKGYTIAVEALGRPADFNPVTDPIVRVEAARLRRRLHTFYEGSGKAEAIRIAIPKGSYTPTIREMPQPTDEQKEHAVEGRSETGQGQPAAPTTPEDAKALRQPDETRSARSADGSGDPNESDPFSGCTVGPTGAVSSLKSSPTQTHEPAKHAFANRLMSARVPLPLTCGLAALCLIVGFLFGGL